MSDLPARNHRMHSRPRLASLFPQGFAHTRWTVDTVAGYLLVISTLYLAIPHLLFYFGWLQWPWAVLAAGSVGVALVITLRLGLHFVAQVQASREIVVLPDVAPENPAGAAEESNRRIEQAALVTEGLMHEEADGFVFTRQHALMIAAICLMWLTLSGVGGFVAQDNDWDKHNTVLNSLMLKPWPTVYEIYKVDIPLVYYIAYYLPAALVGKVGGWFWANQALFLWSMVGLMIAALWFCVLVRRVSYSVLLIFVLFSGQDVIGKLLAHYVGLWNGGRGQWAHIDAWTGLWQYSSQATQLNWVPHQALAGWIVVGMTLYCLVRLRRRELVLLPVGLSAFWSPFVTLGMIPYLVLDFLIDKEPLGLRVRRMISIPNVVGMMALGITGFYFSAKAFPGSPIVIESMFSGLSLGSYDGSTLDGISFLLFFCLIEFGLYAIILYHSGAIQEERWRWMLDITVLTLCILPWFKLGVYNDLVMRASIPALFVLAVLVARAVHDESLARQSRLALMVLLLVGAVTSGIELRRHFQSMMNGDAPIMDSTQLPGDFVHYMQTQAYFFGQYSGAIDSPFFNYAAKPIPEGAKAVAGSEEFALNDHDFILYGNQIYLLQDSITLPAEIAVGTTFTVPWQLHFFGPSISQQTAYQFDPSLRLVDEGGAPVWALDGWPTERPKIAPFAMTQWTGQMTVTVPMTATPGLYTLDVGFYGANNSEYLTAHTVPEAIQEMALVSGTEEVGIGEIVPVGSLQVVE